MEKFLQPLDAGQVQMIGGLVEQDDFRLLHQRFGDGEPLAPASGKRFGLGIEIAEAAAAQGFGLASLPFRFRESDRAHGTPHDAADGLARLEVRILGDVGEARAAAQHQIAGVGLDAPGEDLQQRGLAGAVGSDQAEAVAFLDAEGDAAKQRRRAEGFRNLVGVE